MAIPRMVMLVINSSRPRFRNNHDKVAFVVHASFVASGYKLVAIGRPALAEDALASSPTQDEVGIEGWSDSDEYAFVYVNPKKGSKKVLVKCLTKGDKLLVDAVAEGGTYPAHLEIKVKRYAAKSIEEGDYDAQFKNLDRLITKLQNQILYKLDEGLRPVAYTTRTSSKRKREPAPILPSKAFSIRPSVSSPLRGGSGRSPRLQQSYPCPACWNFPGGQGWFWRWKHACWTT